MSFLEALRGQQLMPGQADELSDRHRTVQCGKQFCCCMTIIEQSVQSVSLEEHHDCDLAHTVPVVSSPILASTTITAFC